MGYDRATATSPYLCVLVVDGIGDGARSTEITVLRASRDKSAGAELSSFASKTSPAKPQGGLSVITVSAEKSRYHMRREHGRAAVEDKSDT